MSIDIGPVLRTLRRQPGVLALVVLEIAAGVATISALLISGAWYGHKGEEPSGIDERNLILVSTYSPTGSPPDWQASAAEWDAVAASVERTVVAQRASDIARVRRVADVDAVAEVSNSVLEDRWSYPSSFVGRRATDMPPVIKGGGVGWAVYADVALPETIGLRFIAGASPREAVADSVGRPVAAVLTRCLAERLFGRGAAASAVGGLLLSEVIAHLPIAGVVEDVAMRMPMMPHARCIAFLFGGAPHDHEARVVVRARPGRRTEVLSALRAAFAVDSRVRFIDVSAFDSTAGTHHRMGLGLTRLLGFFGVLVGIVVLLGALAATSFLVAQRTRQISVRRALGATKMDIVTHFLVESALATAMGSLLGVAGAFGLFLLMRQVFDSIAFDGRLVGLTLVALWAASILATLVPALRAARVPPSVAGRSL